MVKRESLKRQSLDKLESEGKLLFERSSMAHTKHLRINCNMFKNVRVDEHQCLFTYVSRS